MYSVDSVDYSFPHITLSFSLFTEDPQVRFAKSLGFYEDAEWTLNRASLGVSVAVHVC